MIVSYGQGVPWEECDPDLKVELCSPQGTGFSKGEAAGLAGQQGGEALPNCVWWCGKLTLWEKEDQVRTDHEIRSHVVRLTSVLKKKEEEFGLVLFWFGFCLLGEAANYTSG